METAITVAVIAAIASLIAALIPTVKLKTRLILIAIAVVLIFITCVIYGVFSPEKTLILVEVKKGMNTPPVFKKNFITGPNLGPVSCKFVIKAINKSKSQVVVQDIKALFKESKERGSFAQSRPRPTVEIALNLNGILGENPRFIHYPFIIEAKSEVYLRVHFDFDLFNSSGEKLTFKFLSSGYEMLPTIMAVPSIRLIIDDSKSVEVGLQEYFPMFVGQRLLVSPGMVAEVWETSLGNIETHVPKLDHFGVYWKSHVRIKDESGKEKIREWFNELPWYEGDVSVKSGQVVFEVSDVLPFVTISRYGSNPLELYAIDIKDPNNLHLYRYKSKNGRLVPDRNISLQSAKESKEGATIWRLPKEEIGGKKHLYVLMYWNLEEVIKKRKLIFWPFKIYHVEALLPR